MENERLLNASRTKQNTEVRHRVLSPSVQLRWSRLTGDHCSSHTSRLLNKAQKGSTETSEGEFTEQILLER